MILLQLYLHYTHQKVFCHGVDATVGKIREAGFNAYMPAIWHGSGAKWASDLEDLDARFVTYFSGGADPFADLITKAHANDIEVHPWFTVGLKHWNKYPEWAAGEDGAIAGFYNIHNPAFRKYMADMIVEVATKYDVDGISLDYVRTGGFCVTQYCQDDYFQKTGRNLLEDVNYSSLSAIPDAFYHWQADAMEALLRDIRDRVKAVKPHIVISAYAPAGEGFHRLSFPTLSFSPYARNPIYWLQKNLVDLVFDSSYGERIFSVYFEKARSLIDREERFIKVLGNYTKNAEGAVVPRDAMLLKKLIDYNQRRWPGSTSVYLYSRLDQNQIAMLKSGPFKESASTTWSSPPLIYGATDITITQGHAFDSKESVTATDAQDGDLTVFIIIQGTIDTAVPGAYVFTYTVTDKDGNTTTKTRTVTVRAVEQKPIYRFYSQKHQAHFYTTSKEEKDYIQQIYATDVWNYEGIAYHALTHAIENATPIYRFYSQKNAVHFYTASQEEKEHIQNTYPHDIWHYEGIAWYGIR